MAELVPVELITDKIFNIPGHKVMFDRDLAELYGVETKQLKRAVRRNIGRFPTDFMFELTFKEYDSLRCQSGTLEWKGRHSNYLSMAFAEQGVAMLSSVLNSERAVQVNIRIMRMLTRLRSMLEGHKDLQKKIKIMEEKYDEQFRVVFQAIKQLISEKEKPKPKIGF